MQKENVRRKLGNPNHADREHSSYRVDPKLTCPNLQLQNHLGPPLAAHRNETFPQQMHSRIRETACRKPLPKHSGLPAPHQNPLMQAAVLAQRQNGSSSFSANVTSTDPSARNVASRSPRSSFVIFAWKKNFLASIVLLDETATL